MFTPQLSRTTAVPAAQAFLRRATTRLHRRTDSTSVLTALTGPGITLASLRIAMQALARAYRDVDRVLLECAGWCPHSVPAYLPRLPGIHRDLTALQVTVDPFPEQHPQPCLKIPDGEAGYLGMRYVVEGSHLGSQGIYRHVQAAFGSEIHRFGCFWMPDPAVEGSWPLMMKSLNGLQSRSSLACAARAARSTFRHMELYLALDHGEAR